MVRNEVYREYKWFKEGADRVYLDKEDCLEAKRKRLLYLFVRDLSSGVSGEVLSTKEQRESIRRRGEGVSLESKIIGWLFVVILNVGLLFYVYLFAINQTQSRQKAWFISFLMWFVFEVLVSSTAVVLFTHILIPLYVMSDIITIKKNITNDIWLNQSESFQSYLEFNSAMYLFSSWRIAWLCPEIDLSRQILRFHTIWPKKSFKREKSAISSSYTPAIMLTAISRIAVAFFMNFVHFPVCLQDSIIQMVSNVFFGYFILAFLLLYRIRFYLPFILLIFIVILVYLTIKILRSKYNLKESDPPAVIESKENKNIASPTSTSFGSIPPNFNLKDLFTKK